MLFTIDTESGSRIVVSTTASPVTVVQGGQLFSMYAKIRACTVLPIIRRALAPS